MDIIATIIRSNIKGKCIIFKNIRWYLVLSSSRSFRIFKNKSQLISIDHSFFYIKVKVQKLASDFVIFLIPHWILDIVLGHVSIDCSPSLICILYAMNKVHKFWLLFAHHICRLDKVIEYLPAYLVVKYLQK